MQPRYKDTYTKANFAFWKSSARAHRVKGTRRLRKTQNEGNSRLAFIPGLGKLLVPRIWK